MYQAILLSQRYHHGVSRARGDQRQCSLHRRSTTIFRGGLSQRLRTHDARMQGWVSAEVTMILDSVARADWACRDAVPTGVRDVHPQPHYDSRDDKLQDGRLTLETLAHVVSIEEEVNQAISKQDAPKQKGTLTRQSQSREKRGSRP